MRTCGFGEFGRSHAAKKPVCLACSSALHLGCWQTAQPSRCVLLVSGSFVVALKRSTPHHDCLVLVFSSVVGVAEWRSPVRKRMASLGLAVFRYWHLMPDDDAFWADLCAIVTNSVHLRVSPAHRVAVCAVYGVRDRNAHAEKSKTLSRLYLDVVTCPFGLLGRWPFVQPCTMLHVAVREGFLCKVFHRRFHTTPLASSVVYQNITLLSTTYPGYSSFLQCGSTASSATSE